MAQFLSTKGISHHLEEIIKKAKSRLTLISPYLKISQQLFERLKEADQRKVQIQLVYGKNELEPRQRQSLAELDNLILFYYDNLHAKCYFNESHLVIGSMNMYEFSEQNNREMGILLELTTDRQLFTDAVQEADSIIKNSEFEKFAKPAPLKVVTSNSVSRGYCLRCEERIPYNPLRPYCAKCYISWAKYENLEYAEKVCHRCGQYVNSSMAKPECPSCYKLSKVGK